VTDVAELARRIANGHAYRKHVIGRGEYPSITDREQFARLIEDVIGTPDEVLSLRGGRYLYWQAKANLIVIDHPNNPDGGTACRPLLGRDDLKRFS